jgi:hypothetical protein
MAGEINKEVEQAIVDYAMGNGGAAAVLTEQAIRRGLTTAKEIEQLVGWPLSQHTYEMTEAIYDNLKDA